MLGRKIFFITIGFIMILITIFLLGETDYFNKHDYFINKKNGLISIITGSFLHGNMKHLIGNIKVLLLTMPLLHYFYKKDFWQLTIIGIFIPATTIYYLELSVLGISGLTYCYVWFLIFSGIGSKDVYRFICSIFFIVFYGSSLIGVTPLVGVGISWQTHLIGMYVAFFYSIYRYLRK